MTLKTLLLGSAAAFVVVGGAQAADLSVAEPVESVAVCSTFGTKYWYIPGTDTCLRITGNVEFKINLHTLSSTSGDITSGHSSNWDFTTAAAVTFNAMSMTDVGALEGQATFKGTYTGRGDSPGATVALDGAYLKIGALKAGHYGSIANPDSGFVDFVYKSSLADANKLELGWAAAGFALALGIEDPRETWNTVLPLSWNMPLITGKISASQATWSGALSGGFTTLAAGSSWGVNAQVTFMLDAIAAGDKLRLNVAYGDNGFIGGGALVAPATNNGWSAFASFQHMWSSTLASDIDYSYLQRSGGGTAAWKVGADLVWKPYVGFKAKAAVYYTVDPIPAAGVWAGLISLKRSW